MRVAPAEMWKSWMLTPTTVGGCAGVAAEAPHPHNADVRATRAQTTARGLASPPEAGVDPISLSTGARPRPAGTGRPTALIGCPTGALRAAPGGPRAPPWRRPGPGEGPTWRPTPSPARFERGCVSLAPRFLACA